MDDQLPLRLHRIRDAHAYIVMADELDLLEQQAMQIGQDVGYASASLSACLALVIALTSGGMTSDKVIAAYVATAIATGVLGSYFVVR